MSPIAIPKNYAAGKTLQALEDPFGRLPLAQGIQDAPPPSAKLSFWILSLDKSCRISHILLGQPTGPSWERAALKVEISKDGQAWRLIHSGRLFWDGHLCLPLGGRYLARYVRLALPAGDSAPGTVEVWGVPPAMTPDEFALPPALSSFIPALAPGACELSANGAWRGHTLDPSTNDTRWIVDLGDIYPLTGISVGDLCGDVTGNMRIRLHVSRDDLGWERIHAGRLLIQRGALHFPLAGEILARFVSLCMPSRTLNSSEVRIYTARARPIVVERRGDGLGSRLMALMNGFYLARALNTDLKLVWPLMESQDTLIDNTPVFGHSISAAQEIFSQEALEKIILPKTKSTPYAKLDGNQGLGRKELLGVEQHDAKNIINSTNRRLKNILHPGLAPNKHYGIKEAFLTIPFHPAVKHVIEYAYAIDLPEGFAALHMRSGDVVFGAYRREALRHAVRAVPIQLAKMLLESENRPVILFGEDQESLRHLADIYGHTLAAEYYPPNEMSNTQRAFFEIKTTCFDPFPFPTATPEQQARIRDLGEKLDAQRKARQALYPDLTMTGMYNVLEALRQGRKLTAKEKAIHEQGLVTVLRELHDELDAAVAEAYGWPPDPADLPDEEILSRLVALNTERVEEEKNGLIRWLRPEYQTKSKAERKAIQASIDIAPPAEPAAKGKKDKPAKAKAEDKQPWPSDLLEQTQAVRGAVDVLRDNGIAVTADNVAERFTRAPRTRVQEILQALETLGFM